MFDFVEATDKATHERQIYHAMVHFADAVRWRCFAAHSVSLTLESVTTDWQAVGNVTTKLKQEGFWDDTVVVFSTDKCASHPHSCVPCCLFLTRCCDAAAARSMTTARPAQIIGP